MWELPLRGVRWGLDKRKSPVKSGFGIEEKVGGMNPQDRIRRGVQEPKALHMIGDESVMNGTDKLTTRQIDGLIEGVRARRSRLSSPVCGRRTLWRRRGDIRSLNQIDAVVGTGLCGYAVDGLVDQHGQAVGAPAQDLHRGAGSGAVRER